MEYVQQRDAAAIEAVLTESKESFQLDKLVSACEALELLYIGGPADARVIESQVYCLHLLALMLTEEATAARVVWKRISASLKVEGSDLSQAWAVVCAVLAADFGNVYTLLKHAWDPSMQPFIELWKANYRQKRIETIGKTFSEVRVDTIMLQCDMVESELQSECDMRGWELDSSTGSVKIVLAHPASRSRALQHTTELIHKMSEYITQFKTEPLIFDSSVLTTAHSAADGVSGVAGLSALGTGVVP